MERLAQLIAERKYAAAIERATAGDLGCCDRRSLLGLALAGAGDLKAATQLLNQVALERPAEPHPCLELPAILWSCGREEWIPFCLLSALAARPRSPLVALALARHYREGGQNIDALRLARHAAVILPSLAEAHRLLGWILADLGDLTTSAQHSERAADLDPLDAAAWSNLGVALTDLGRHAEGYRAHQFAVGLAPQSARVRVNRAVNLLAQGRYQEAWDDFEWRLELPNHTALPRATLLPNLEGGVSLAGRTVLMTHEDGLGDSIQFARFVPMLERLGARVILHAPPPLERLFRSLSPTVIILPDTAAVPDHDYHCPYTSLPRAFRVNLDNIPTQPYLFADPALADRWKFRLALTGRKIGLVWAGQARPWIAGYGVLDGRRSMKLLDLSSFSAASGISWVSLQKGPAEAELADPPEFAREMAAHTPMREVRDFADTAAIIAGLDMVISVDTSVAHLAGALGKPVLLLDRFDTCWRWLRNRNDSPWYPRLRLFRQTRIGDWVAPVNQILNILLEHNDISGVTKTLC